MVLDLEFGEPPRKFWLIVKNEKCESGTLHDSIWLRTKEKWQYTGNFIPVGGIYTDESDVCAAFAALYAERPIDIRIVQVDSVFTNIEVDIVMKPKVKFK